MDVALQNPARKRIAGMLLIVPIGKLHDKKVIRISVLTE